MKQGICIVTSPIHNTLAHFEHAILPSCTSLTRDALRLTFSREHLLTDIYLTESVRSHYCNAAQQHTFSSEVVSSSYEQLLLSATRTARPACPPACLPAAIVPTSKHLPREAS